MDDVLIDAPYIITEEMIQSLNISIVVTGKHFFSCLVTLQFSLVLCWQWRWEHVEAMTDCQTFFTINLYKMHLFRYVSTTNVGAVETKRKFRSDSSDGSDSDGRGK